MLFMHIPNLFLWCESCMRINFQCVSFCTWPYLANILQGQLFVLNENLNYFCVCNLFIFSDIGISWMCNKYLIHQEFLVQYNNTFLSSIIIRQSRSKTYCVSSLFHQSTHLFSILPHTSQGLIDLRLALGELYTEFNFESHCVFSQKILLLLSYFSTIL